MSDDSRPPRLTPESFGYVDPDLWVAPSDDDLAWLAADDRVDASNKDVRRGAHEEKAGKRFDDNPFFVWLNDGFQRREAMSSRAKSWAEGWRASGHHYKRFDRDADDRFKAELERWMRDNPPQFPPLGRGPNQD